MSSSFVVAVVLARVAGAVGTMVGRSQHRSVHVPSAAAQAAVHADASSVFLGAQNGFEGAAVLTKSLDPLSYGEEPSWTTPWSAFLEITAAGQASTGSHSGGPATLGEYCSGKKQDGGRGVIIVGEKIEANWRNYGTFYRGKVTKVNADGTFDVLYDDGWTEKHLPARQVREMPPTKKFSMDPKKDPACKLDKFVGKMKYKVGEVRKKVRTLMAERSGAAKNAAARRAARQKRAANSYPAYTTRRRRTYTYSRRRSYQHEYNYTPRRRRTRKEMDYLRRRRSYTSPTGDEGKKAGNLDADEKPTTVGKGGGEESFDLGGAGDEGKKAGNLDADEKPTTVGKGGGEESFDLGGLGGGAPSAAGPNAGVAGAPSPAAAASPAADAVAPLEGKIKGVTPEQQAEIDKMKQQLAEKDSEIADLQEHVKDMGQAIDMQEEEQAIPPDQMTIEDLLARLRAKLAKKAEKVDCLQKQLLEQDQKLDDDDVDDYVSVADIDELVKDLSNDVEEAKEQRQKLSKEGKLDPELKNGIDKIIREDDRLNKQLGVMEALEKKAREQKIEAAKAKLAAAKAKAETLEEAEDDALHAEAMAPPSLKEARKQASLEAERAHKKALEDASRAQEDLDEILAETKAEEEAKKEEEKALGAEAGGTVSFHALSSNASANATAATKKHSKRKTAAERAQEQENLDKEEKKAEEKAKSAEKELEEALMAMDKDLAGVQAGTKILDTGVHPNGEKWWRFRYEHAYVEGFVGIVIALSMLIFERIFYNVRHWVYESARASQKDVVTHGTGFIMILEYATAEMMVCLLTFLTCWTTAQLGGFRILAWFLDEVDGAVCAPTDYLEYRIMVYDLCVSMFVAVIFYYVLVLSVVYQTSMMLGHWAKLDRKFKAHIIEPGRLQLRGRDMSLNDYALLKSDFVEDLAEDERLMATIRERVGKDFNANDFDFLRYIKNSVRLSVDRLFKFGCVVWSFVIVTFIVLVFLHRFAHVGYIRVMAVYFVVFSILLLVMMSWVRGVKQSHNQDLAMMQYTPREAHEEKIGLSEAPWFRHEYWTQHFAFLFLHYVLFFLCYGASRMVTQPWMWELHFWPVFFLTLVVIFTATLFCLVVAPLIPEFAVALCLPPYIDETDIDSMVEVAHDMVHGTAKRQIRSAWHKANSFGDSA